jgi:hypothetical protein
MQLYRNIGLINQFNYVSMCLKVIINIPRAA